MGEDGGGDAAMLSLVQCLVDAVGRGSRRSAEDGQPSLGDTLKGGRDIGSDIVPFTKDTWVSI